jgi:hypothetical protein
VANQKLGIILEVDTRTGEAAIKRVNAGLDSMGKAASAAGQAGRRGMDSMSESLTAGVLKANLLTRALELSLSAAKAWSVDAAKYASRTETLAIVTERLALSNGLSVAAVNRNVEAVRKLGITTQESHNTINQMIVAQLDVAKASQLARLAQDAAVVAGVNSSEALGTIIAGIVEQRVQMLRTMGISISFEHAFKRQAAAMGKTVDQLSEFDKKQIALNEVLKKAPELAGAYEAAMGTAGKQMFSLTRYVDEAKNAVGKELLPAMSQVITFMTGAAQHVQRHAELYAGLARVLAIAGAAFGAMKALAWIGLPPWLTLVAAAVTGLAAAYVLLRSKTDVQHEAIEKHIIDLKQERAELDHAGLSAKDYADQLERINRRLFLADIDEARNDADRARSDAGKSVSGFAAPSAPVQFPTGVGGIKYGTYESRYNHAGKDGLTSSERAKKLAAEEQAAAERERLAIENRRRTSQQMKQAESELQRAVESRQQAEANAVKAHAEGVLEEIKNTQNQAHVAALSLDLLSDTLKEYAAERRKVQTEEDRLIKERSTRVDEKTGRTRTVQLPAGELALLRAATQEKFAALDLAFNTEQEKRVAEMWKAAASRTQKFMKEFYFDPLSNQATVTEAVNESRDRGGDQALVFARQQIDQRREYELAQLGSINAVTIQSKLYVEQQKTAIEAQAARDRTDIEIQQIDRRADHDRAATIKALHEKGVYNDALIKQATDEVDKNADAERDAARNARDAELRTLQARSAAEQARTIQDHYRQIFDSLKQQAGGVFDAMLSKSKSVWQAMGDTLKTALLTAIKEVVTSRIAAMLLQLFTGARTTFAGGGIGNAGGTPVFGGGGGGAALGAAGVVLSGAGAGGGGGRGGLGALFGLGGGGGAPITTPPFIGGDRAGGIGARRRIWLVRGHRRGNGRFWRGRHIQRGRRHPGQPQGLSEQPREHRVHSGARRRGRHHRRAAWHRRREGRRYARRRRDPGHGRPSPRRRAGCRGNYGGRRAHRREVRRSRWRGDRRGHRLRGRYGAAVHQRPSRKNEG